MIDPISWAFSWPWLLGALLAGYAIGSVPFGLIVTRLGGAGDVRAIGSGNIGATNVLRTGSPGLAALTLALDAGKGAVVVVAANAYGPDITVVAAAGAFLGHLFPVWLGFRGGKGVAVALGIFLAMEPLSGVLCCAVWLAFAALFRYASVASLASMAAGPFGMWWLGESQLVEFSAAVAVLVWLCHWRNMMRLAAGTEARIAVRPSKGGRDGNLR